MALERARKFREAEEKKKAEEDALQFDVLKPGDAVHFPKENDSVAIHYIGYLEDGTCFDDSYIRGQPIYFILGEGHIVKGLEMILLSGKISRGTKLRVTLASEFAYGTRGYPPIIPPNAALTFEMELLSFTAGGNPERINA